MHPGHDNLILTKPSVYFPHSLSGYKTCTLFYDVLHITYTTKFYLNWCLIFQMLFYTLNRILKSDEELIFTKLNGYTLYRLLGPTTGIMFYMISKTLNPILKMIYNHYKPKWICIFHIHCSLLSPKTGTLFYIISQALNPILKSDE